MCLSVFVRRLLDASLPEGFPLTHGLRQTRDLRFPGRNGRI